MTRFFLYGHNMAETQTVLWARILDPTRGEDPPRIVCVDPRRTAGAEEAERSDGVLPTDTDYCETYGYDLATGRDDHRAGAPGPVDGAAGRV